LKVVVPTVEPCTASLNVAITEEVTAIPVALFTGFVLVTEGGIVSVGWGFAPVVNDHTLSAAIAFPAKSFTPVVIVIMYDVEYESGEECEKVTVLRSVLNANVPGKLVPALFFTVNIVGLDQLCTGSLNVAVIIEVTSIPAAPFAGLELTTVGAIVSPGGGGGGC